jgi:hypothetical protein
MVVGAILAFAVRDSWSAIDLTAVGYILMVAGAVGIALSFYLINKRRRVRTDVIDPAVEEQYRVVEEHRRDVTE